MNTKKLVLISLFASLIAVLSQMSIPMPSGVPLTLQTFAVTLTGVVLGYKIAPIAVLVYIALGAASVPVFSNFKGGLQVLFGSTGGFIFGFVFFSLFCGIRLKEKKITEILLCCSGLLICHILGTLQFSILSNISFVKCLSIVSLPFIPKDILSVISGYLIGIKIKSKLQKTIDISKP